MHDLPPTSQRPAFVDAPAPRAAVEPAPADGAPGEVPASWAQLRGGGDDDRFWDTVRQQYFIEEGLHYLNCGTYGPTLRAACDAACRGFVAMGANYNKAFRENMTGEAVPRLIGRVARFVGAKPDEVAFTSGTTESMNYIANGLDLRRGDEILTTKHEHLGGIYPWLLKARRFGARVRQIDLRTPPASHAELLGQFEGAISPRTRVLSFCHVQYTDGTVLPVRELCAMARRRGIISVVDGAQAIGMLDFRIGDLGCDFYAASLHKWLTSPYGCGLLYVREDMRERLWPTVVLSQGGWDTVNRDGIPGVTDVSYALNYPAALLKYSSNIEYYAPLYRTVALCMDFQDLVGRERIEARIGSLATRLVDGLCRIPGVVLHTPRDPALRGGLVSFRVGRIGTQDLVTRLRNEYNVVARFVTHPGMAFDVNRLSTHIFNSTQEVDGVVAAIGDLAAAA